MHEQIIGIYERTSREWDEARGKTLFERPWLDRFVELLPPLGSVLDLGCGSGEPIARYLIESGYELTGLDSSPSMIALCWERFPVQQWLVTDMRHLSLSRCFDGVIAWHSFFHLCFDDQREMFARFAAHTKPGGALMFTSGPRHDEAIGEWQGEPLYHASLAPDEYRALLAESGFTVVRYQADDPDCGGATVWLARKAPRSDLRAGSTDRLTRRLRQANPAA